MGASGPHARRRHGPLLAERDRASNRRPPASRDRIADPPRRRGGAPALPGPAAARGRAPEPQPARRGDPGRRRSGASARGLPRPHGPRGRGVHLGEGLLRLQPDQPGGLPSHRGACEGAAARALPACPAPSLPPPRRSPDAEVHQPRHGGASRPRPDGDSLSRGARRGGVRPAPCGCRAPGLPSRVSPGAARAHRLGDRAPSPRRRAHQAAHRQGRQPRHGAHRGRRAWLAPGALHDEGRGGRQLQAHGGVRLPPGARPGRPPRYRQPQPLRRRPRPVAPRRIRR